MENLFQIQEGIEAAIGWDANDGSVRWSNFDWMAGTPEGLFGRNKLDRNLRDERMCRQRGAAYENETATGNIAHCGL
jgi:hypothetical protein